MEHTEDFESTDHGILRRVGAVRVGDYILAHGRWTLVDRIGVKYVLIDGRSLWDNRSPKTEETHPEDFVRMVAIHRGGDKEWHRTAALIIRHASPEELAEQRRRESAARRAQLNAMGRATA